ncbi:MAG: thioredoxin-disulfide reductase [Deltaproteobacteria bacterium RBG_13_58_19]|nr:MAG: thioredoxin-disulfide reductase [Deltaproteobacteria bacterium RBG_13_58_19]
MAPWDYDLLIIGGGPAGLTAGLYAGRARLKTLLLEKLIHGGQMMTTDLVENYPGFPDGISGFELSDRMRRQAERFGLEIINAEVLKLEPGPPAHKVILADRQLSAGAVLIATGASYKRLGVPGEAEFIGKGVSFCATCDGALYRDQEIALVGGGDTALSETIFLERFAKKIHLIHRRRELRGAKYLQERLLQLEKVEIHWDSVVTAIKGNQAVEALELKDVKTQGTSTLPVAGVFIAIGINPNTAWLNGLLPMDDWGFIITDPEMATPIQGIFAAGDVRAKSLWQIATAVGDGATAAFAAEKYLENLSQG